MDEVSDLRLFARLIEAGTISAAAQLLESSPAAVSRRLARLEARLGVRLITRTSRHFEPTDEGRLFYERCTSILREIGKAEAEAASRGTTPSGDLKISAPMGLGRRHVAAMIGRFGERYPDVRVQLVLSDAGLDVVDDSLDIAIRVGLPLDTDVVARKLLSQRRLVCGSPDYFARFGVPTTPEDLARHNCMCLVRRRGVFDKWPFEVHGQPRDVRVSGTLSSTSSEVLRDWALDGKGLALLATWDIADVLRSGRLQQCLQDCWCDVVELYAIFVSKRHLPLRIRKFLDHLADEFANLSDADPQGAQAKSARSD